MLTSIKDAGAPGVCGPAPAVAAAAGVPDGQPVVLDSCFQTCWFLKLLRGSRWKSSQQRWSVMLALGLQWHDPIASITRTSASSTSSTSSATSPTGTTSASTWLLMRACLKVWTFFMRRSREFFTRRSRQFFTRRSRQCFSSRSRQCFTGRPKHAWICV